VLTKFTPGQQAVFEPNKNYWGRAPKNGGLIINYYSKSSTMKLDLEKGNLDMAFQTFAPNEVSAMQGQRRSPCTRARGGDPLSRLQRQRAAFDDINVRKAIAYLMPRQRSRPASITGRCRRSTRWCRRASRGRPTRFKTLYGASPNLAKAKAAMRGLETPLPITIWWTPTHYGDASSDELHRDPAGARRPRAVHVTLKSAEWASTARRSAEAYDAFQLGWFPDYPDADDYTSASTRRTPSSQQTTAVRRWTS
jgi:peptide/nickel transport system substrate-binding protein